MKGKNVVVNLVLLATVTATTITGFNVMGARHKLDVAVNNVDSAIAHQNEIKQQIKDKNKSIVTDGKSVVFDFMDVVNVTDAVSKDATLENIKVFDVNKTLIKETQDATEPLELNGTNIVEYTVKVTDVNTYVAGLAAASIPISKLVVYPKSNVVHVRGPMEGGTQ